MLALRVLTAAVLIQSIVTHDRAASGFATTSEDVAATFGLLILVGLWTPIAGALTFVVELGLAISGNADPWRAIALATLGISLAMIGPGAWSIDARLFGRKQIAARLP